MRITQTVYVTDHQARLRTRRGTLVVEQPSGWQRVPIETLDGVILTGRAEISNNAIGQLVQRGVRIAALSKTGRVRFIISGPTTGNVHLRLAQFSASTNPEATHQISRWLVAGKLQNYLRIIQRWAWDSPASVKRIFEEERNALAERINTLESAGTGDKIRGIEGDGTRRYFKCLAIHLSMADTMIDFQRRSRRPPRNHVNALLSFTYGLVLAELIGALDAVGLDPQIGFLHRPRAGRPSLALDLLEELRPAIADRFTITVLSRQQIRPDHFTVVGDAYYLSDEGRKAALSLYEGFRNEEVPHKILNRHVGRWALPSIQATLMARYLRDDLPAYPPYLLTN